jgi:hypothetical protein
MRPPLNGSIVGRTTMALPKKGARPITIDGRRFRWSIRPMPTYCMGNGWSRMTFAVEAAEASGCILYVTLARPRPDNWMLEGSTPVTPGEVAKIVSAALKSGWNPTEPGSRFEVAESAAASKASST